MSKNTIEKNGNGLDYAFLAPVILLLLSFVCGIIPSLFCSLNKIYFANTSILLFFISIGFHFYILFLWRRYEGTASLAYALCQPIMHIVILAFATIVSATNTCDRVQQSRGITTVDSAYFSSEMIIVNEIPSIIDKIEEETDKLDQIK